MDNQHKKIKGYRELTEEEIALMNEVKTLANQVGALVEKLEYTDGINRRWCEYGKIDLQKGFMAIVRSIAKPESF